MGHSPQLGRWSANFADEVQSLLDGVLPGAARVESVLAPRAERYIVRPSNAEGSARGVALFVGGSHLADLRFAFYLVPDRTGTYLKTARSDIAVHSVLDRAPLVRLEYLADMRTEPVAHWQFHAERGSFTHLLTHAHDQRRIAKPHDLSALHFPVGGERFRPWLEDVLQFLVLECGVDRRDGWRAAVEDGRRKWRHRQLGAALRDAPAVAADALRGLGWTVVMPPGDVAPDVENSALTAW